MNRLPPLMLLAMLLIGTNAFPQANDSVAIQQHNAWLGEQLKQLLSIKPGVTRAEVRKFMTTDGGVYDRAERTYMGKECTYCKVHITFRLVGAAENDGESANDIVEAVSTPYLGFDILN